MGEIRTYADLTMPGPGNINRPMDPDGNTYLHLLCLHKAPGEAIRQALQAGADPNIINNRGLPPLFQAIRFCELSAIHALIAGGAEIYFKTPRDRIFNAVLVATQDGNETALRMIIAHGGGAHVNKSGIGFDGTESGFPCLHVAVRASQRHLLAMLVAAGALPNMEAGPMRRTPLELAVMETPSQILSLVALGADLERRHPFSNVTPLLLAADEGKHWAVENLLAAGANPDAARPDGMTALMIAAEDGNLNIARALIQYKATLDLRRDAPPHETALMIAAAHGSTNVAEALVTSGADILLADDFNRTAIRHAQNNARTFTVKSLVDAETRALQKRHEDAHDQLRTKKSGGPAP